jgi:hypothetical protein
MPGSVTTGTLGSFRSQEILARLLTILDWHCWPFPLKLIHRLDYISSVKEGGVVMRKKRHTPKEIVNKLRFGASVPPVRLRVAQL